MPSRSMAAAPWRIGCATPAGSIAWVTRWSAAASASVHMITEMTYDEEAGGSMHLGRKDVEGLMTRHPSTRFIITHRGNNGSVNGAVMARDFLTLHLPL